MKTQLGIRLFFLMGVFIFIFFFLKYFSNKDLEQQIDKDLNRLFPEYSFFRKTSVGDILREVLIVWSRDHTEEGYKQGLPELCAVIYYVFVKVPCPDKKPLKKKDGSHSDIVSVLCDQEYIAHDVYTAFEFVCVNYNDELM
jgi:hypothetical protein